MGRKTRKSQTTDKKAMGPSADALSEQLRETGILGDDREDDPNQMARVRDVMAQLSPEARGELQERIEATGTLKRVRIKRFCEHFQLTSAEAKLVDSLCAGKTSEDHAELHSISLNTVRTHLQRIREKVGVNRQAQVISKALSWES